MAETRVRQALPADVRQMHRLIEPYVNRRILLGKELVNLFEAIQEFVVAEVDGKVVGCGALHVMWEDLGEIRTIAVDEGVLGHGEQYVTERKTHTTHRYAIFSAS